MAISHRWKGAAPNFINKMIPIIIWCCINLIEEIRKIIEAIDWNKKYLIGWVEGFSNLEVNKSNINLNILTSIHSQTMSKEDLLRAIIKLIKFIKILNTTSKGEIKKFLFGL